MLPHGAAFSARGSVKSLGGRRMLARSRLLFWRLPFSHLSRPSLPRIAARRLVSAALLAISAYLCSAALNPAAAEPADLEEDYGEFTARPEELASMAINDIVKSLRLNNTAMV